MGGQMDVWKNERDDLTNKRNALFSRYSRKPNDLQLASEIKKIDDAIADCTEKMTQETLSVKRERSGKIRPTPTDG
jgi:uncharacterized protein YoxC